MVKTEFTLGSKLALEAFKNNHTITHKMNVLGKSWLVETRPLMEIMPEVKSKKRTTYFIKND